MAEEESDATAFVTVERSPETVWPVWSRVHRTAWLQLKDDRFYGAMGGMGRIYYTSLSRYAADHGIPLYPFIEFVSAIDAEFVAWSAEKKPADATPE